MMAGAVLSIPDDVMSVVKVIRREVPRPRSLPTPSRGKRNELRWESRGVRCCPMGLCTRARVGLPLRADTFGYLHVSNSAVRQFGIWWDGQTNAQGAVDALWGTP